MRDLTAVCAAARHISLTEKLEPKDGGGEGAQKEVEREARARSCTWSGVKGCGNKSAALWPDSTLDRKNVYPFSVELGVSPLHCGR